MSENRYRGRFISGEGAPNWWIAHVVRATIAKLLMAIFRTRFIGRERVPATGAIIAGNHVSYLDPALLWSGLPRPTHFVAKEELWSVGWLGWALDRLWAFPVKRGTADRDMLALATKLLGHGELVGMFPEGTRNREATAELGEAYGGVAYLAMRSGVPVVPVGIHGTDAAWPAGQKLPRFVRVCVQFGDPVSPDDFTGTRKEKVEAMTAEIMRRISAAREEAKESACA